MLKPHKWKEVNKEGVLTTRDYIAIKCLPFFLDKMSDLGYGIVAEHAYLMADRLIEKRERK